jgi:hypothetical protein
MGVVRVVLERGNIVNIKQDLGRHVSIVDEGVFLVLYGDRADDSHMVCEGGRPCERWLVFPLCHRGGGGADE